MKIKGTKISKRTLALLAAAVILFGAGGVTGTKAAIGATSRIYKGNLKQDQLNVAVVENGAQLGNDAVLLKSTFPDENSKLAPGYPYREEIAAKNTNPSGSADEYIRMVVRKYWKVEKAKDVEVNPSDIQLCVGGTEGTIGSGWKENTAEATDEMNVYYYSSAVAAGQSTSNLFDTLIVDSEVLSYTIKQETIDTGIRYTYVYDFDGYSVCIEAEAQAVQTHNGKDAIKSIWGVDAGTVGITVTD